MSEIVDRLYKLFHLTSLKNRIRFWFIFLMLLFTILCFVPLSIFNTFFEEIKIQNQFKEVISLQQIIVDIFTIPLVIVVILGLIIIFFLSNRLDRAIMKILEGAKSIASGNYSFRIEPLTYTNEPKELQEVCRTFNQMAEMIEGNVHSIQSSIERYREIVELSPLATVVHQDDKIVYANPAFVRLLKGHSIADLQGKNILCFIHEDYQEIVKERMALLKNQTPVDLIEEKYIRLDGSVIDVEVIATPIEYMYKPAFQVIIQDICNRKKMEREFQQSQEKYRSVVNNVKEVIFQTNSRGQWTFLNPAWTEITGFTVEESLGKSILDYIHPDDRSRNFQILRNLIEGNEEYYRMETRYITKENETRWIEMFARLTVDEQGQIIGTSGTLDDITKRKEAEDDLQASEELFRLLAESSSDMITLHDADGKYLYISPACKELLNYEPEEIIGHVAYEFIHNDDLELIKKNHELLLENGSTIVAYRIRRKDGVYLWFESSVKVLHETYPNDIRLIAVSRNINERKLAEEKLKEANEMLQRLSTIDGLTGASNRRAFDERLEIEWNHSRRNSEPLSLIMLDIDYFKPYNDVYGHLGGDGCLKQVSSTIQSTLERSTDFFCRYGGEEFCIILPNTDKEGARKVGEKIRTAVEAMNIPHAQSKISPWVTVSVGTATIIPSLYSSPVNLISNADKAVYQAKRDGRNCVRSYE